MLERPHSEVPTRGLTFLDGSRVGIANLDKILEDVVALRFIDPMSIRRELLERVKACNYVPRSAEGEYAAALFRDYQEKTGAIKASPKDEASSGPG